MRRHVATFVAAAFLLTLAGPAVAADPAAPPPAESSAPVATPSPEPTLLPSTSPSSEPSAPAEPVPSAIPSPDATSVPRQTVTGPRQYSADPTGRWIVVYRNGTDVTAASARQAKVVGFTADRTFKHAIRGFSARLNAQQVNAIRSDPAVLEVVPDERIELTSQLVPTGINRVDGRLSAVAKVDGIDDRVDADVAIVDTGIAKVADLNVAGGYNCSTSDRSLWRDAAESVFHASSVRRSAVGIWRTSAVAAKADKAASNVEISHAAAA